MELKTALSGKVLQEWLNSEYLSIKKIEKVRKNFQNNKPFPHIALFNFLKEEKAKKLLHALQKETFEEKEADLFKFMQTKDLAGTKNSIVADFHTILASEEFITYMSYVTDSKLKKGKVDMSGSLYQNTDYLLPHDDRLETRKVAYMVYLSTLKERDGGKLILYSTANKQPVEEETAIVPEFNTLVFFKVSEKSFHEVEEVITNIQRITLGGWFHG